MKRVSIVLIVFLFLSSLSAAEEFEKYVMITCGVVITTFTCVGMFLEHCKRQEKIKQEQKKKYETYQAVLLSVVETKKRF